MALRRMGPAPKTVLKQRLEAYLKAAAFPDEFSVLFKKAGRPRKPDDYFHPSTHPSWGIRKLFYYIARPDDLIPEQMEYENRMAVTMGTAVHSFLETCIRDAGYMAPLEGSCEACSRPHGHEEGQCEEYGASDPVLRSRGHMDGVLEIDEDGDYWQAGTGVFELKTTSSYKLQGIKDNDLATFREKWPQYYHQVQEYMRMTGHTQSIVLFVALGFPWLVREFQVPYDPEHARAIERKYEYVRLSVALDMLPKPCCEENSDEARKCPARAICPIGQLTYTPLETSS